MLKGAFLSQRNIQEDSDSSFQAEWKFDFEQKKCFLFLSSFPFSFKMFCEKSRKANTQKKELPLKEKK